MLFPNPDLATLFPENEANSEYVWFRWCGWAYLYREKSEGMDELSERWDDKYPQISRSWRSLDNLNTLSETP